MNDDDLMAALRACVPVSLGVETIARLACTRPEPGRAPLALACSVAAAAIALALLRAPVAPLVQPSRELPTAARYRAAAMRGEDALDLELERDARSFRVVLHPPGGHP